MELPKSLQFLCENAIFVSDFFVEHLLEEYEGAADGLKEEVVFIEALDFYRSRATIYVFSAFAKIYAEKNPEKIEEKRMIEKAIMCTIADLSALALEL